MKEKTYKRIKTTLAVFLAFFLAVAIFASVLMALSYTVDFSARILPSYEKEDISALLQKEEWTDGDYDYLYHQTGLGRSALIELKDTPDKILEFQNAFFFEAEFRHEMAAFTTPCDLVTNAVFPLAPLKDGDVLVSSSTHTFGWRNGHAAIVVNSAQGLTLESMALGEPSTYGTVEWFQTSSNFMILRLKEEYLKEVNPAEIAQAATENLLNVRYSLFVGFLYGKDQCKNGKTASVTHCSHIVWQAFKNFGIDIDSNGGPLVTSKDIANSPCFEVIQVNGFNPDKLWN